MTYRPTKVMLPPDTEHYFSRTQRPLQSLIFLLPLLFVYELGTLYYATNLDTGQSQFIRARSILAKLLDLFGAGGDYLPGLMLVVVLFVWHLARRDPWRFEWRLYGGMLVESFALALPLLVFGMIWGQRALQVVDGVGGVSEYTWRAEIIFSLGAGLYEELVFRLMVIALIHMLVVDIFGLKHGAGAMTAIGMSALLFGLYHFESCNVLAWSGVEWARFVYIFIAGLYLAVIYVLRGFGVVVATHAIYDILIVIMKLGADAQISGQ